MESTDKQDAAGFGLALKDAREAARITQGQLAEIAGYADKTSISKMENGKLERPPSRATIERIADALDVSPGPLLKAAGYDQDPLEIGDDEIAEVVGLLDQAEKTIERLRARLERLGRQP